MATLVLVTPDGELLGKLAPFPVETPWWQDAEPVVRGAREHHGIDVTILRLLDVEPGTYPGGAVTYLAEVEATVDARSWADRIEIEAWDGQLDDHPLRQTWARPGGPAADLDWAESVLAMHGIASDGAPVQSRTWNLSSLWRLPIEGGQVWLKVVPPFFSHEGRILDRIQGRPVPRMIAHDGARLLMEEIPGPDLYEATEPLLIETVELLVGLQREWIGGQHELLALGLPDWRAPALAGAIASLVERTAPDLSRTERDTMTRFVDGLERRFLAVAECGLPDTLVHGDFHDGNFRGDGTRIVLLDWGDSGVGHPLLDEPAFLDRVPQASLRAVRERWHGLWRAAVPGSDPERASELLAPVAAARQAVIYQHFLDNIEPTERPYHASDPLDWLQRTAALCA